MTEVVEAVGAATGAAAQSLLPKVAPELRQWILDQARARVAIPAILQGMLTAGWQEAVAIDAIERVLESELGQAGVRQAWAVPEIPIEGQQTVLCLADRQVSVLMALQRPRIVLLGGFLSDDECQALIDAARPRMQRSLTIEPTTGGSEQHESRTSEGMFFAVGETDLVQRIERRIEQLVQWPVSRGEGMQVLRYGPGAEYRPHHDYFDANATGTQTILRRGGQRVGTLVMYLNDVPAGGGTVFPELGLSVSALRGNAVFFSYPVPHASTKTLHGGAPVLDGEKWVATKWLRQGEFR